MIKLIEYLQKYSTIPKQFLDDFYKVFNNTIINSNKININLNNVIKWLNIKKKNAKDILLKSYKKNIDYRIKKVIKKGSIKKKELINITVNCFKKICKLIKSKLGNKVLKYLIVIELLLNNYKNYIIRKKLEEKSFYSRKKVQNIIKKYDIKHKNKVKTLVICHGKTHYKKFKNALLLNRLNIVKPNILSNAWSKKEMKYIPKEYFDIIIMEYCPLSNPFSKENKQLWENLYRILKKGGKIENSSILNLYAKNVKQKWYYEMNNKEKSNVKTEIEKHIKKLNFKIIKHSFDLKKDNDKISIIIK